MDSVIHRYKHCALHLHTYATFSLRNSNDSHLNKSKSLKERVINDFTTAFAVLHLVTLTVKDGSLHGSDHLVQSRAVVKVVGIGWDRRSLSSEYFQCSIPFQGPLFYRCKDPLHALGAPSKTSDPILLIFHFNHWSHRN